MHIAVGPFGGSKGKNWDTEAFMELKKSLSVMNYEGCIDSICMVYAKNGNVVHGEVHGGMGAGYQAKITLNHPEEYLIGVTCHFPCFEGQLVVKSISFKSNRRSFGPNGKEQVTQLCLPVDGGKIVGLRGKSGKYLNALGFHLAPVHHDKMKTRL